MKRIFALLVVMLTACTSIGCDVEVANNELDEAFEEAASESTPGDQKSGEVEEDSVQDEQLAD